LRETGASDNDVDEAMAMLMSTGALSSPPLSPRRALPTPPAKKTQPSPQSNNNNNNKDSLVKTPSIGGAKEVCVVCEKRVYATERLAVDGLVFHKPCLRCAHCKRVLTPSTYAALSGKFYW
jgi:hypothetical protein